MGLIFLRVISGSVRGKKLISPADDSIRPTLDRVKESIFNMISFSVPEARVLDLFAGSGALGIEALSRGAEKTVFVDKNSDSLKIVKENLALTSLAEGSECYLSDFSDFLKNCDEKFDLIFLDPPYADGLLDEALNIIYEKKLLADDGYIVCESDSEPFFSPNESYFQIHRNKRYGRVQILLLTNV